MAGTYFFTFLAAFLLALPFLLYAMRQRWRSGARLIVKEDYEYDPQGGLITDHAHLSKTARMLHLRTPDTTHHIPFEDIAGVFMQIRTSRKIHMGVILRDSTGPHGGWLALSTVTNNDLRQAGINAYRLADVLADDGEALLQAFRDHEWPRNLLGASFEYRFTRPDD